MADSLGSPSPGKPSESKSSNHEAHEIKNPSRRAAKGPSKQPPAANFPRILQPQGHKNLDGHCWLWRTHLQLAKQMVHHTLPSPLLSNFHLHLPSSIQFQSVLGNDRDSMQSCGTPWDCCIPRNACGPTNRPCGDTSAKKQHRKDKLSMPTDIN